MTALTTSARAELLSTRLTALRAERDQAQLELVGGASGDAADRATNVDANVRFALLEQRIHALELELAELPLRQRHDGEVTIGDVVVLDLGDGRETFLIGSVDEATDGTEVLTPTSPLGRVVVGAAVGDTVTYEPRRGRSMLATIVSVE
ncbi:GreA/GreB family elongation factor [uncultured Jatrophihabitans sp.]|uniref:GreA/GreB family elongation factor n=1 Tax=uncultured Jatrophihabitans sp. TaxID=1610747 RepID=UPI0035CC051F